MTIYLLGWPYCVSRAKGLTKLTMGQRSHKHYLAQQAFSNIYMVVYSKKVTK